MKGHVPWTYGLKGQLSHAPCSEETKRKIGIANTKPRVERICGSCGVKFGVWPSVAKAGRGLYCSRACGFEAQKGKPSWNKGLKGYKTGPRPDVVMPTGKLNKMWKGEKVQYRALHSWVERRLGKPDTCTNCRKVACGHGMHWANRSGDYKRVITDWVRLCVKCHKAYDCNELALKF